MYSEHAMTLPAGQFPPTTVENTQQSFPAVENEILTPEQFFGYARSSAVSWTGERRLLLAVLEDAVANFLRYKTPIGKRESRLFREEYEWFWSTEKKYLYAFETICAHLHLDPDYIRAGLEKLRRKTSSVSLTVERERVSPYRRVEL